MNGQRKKVLLSILALLPIVTLLFSAGVLSEVSYAQKTRRQSQRNGRQRNRLQITIYPPGYIVSPEAAQKVREALLAGAGNDHDDPMNLAEYGDIDSVPAMIAVLKRNPANGKWMVCTRAHCLTALRKLTKADVGDETEDWEKWWAAYQKERKEK
ncbi:MAG TPA: hypothetical protein VJ810_35855 [Blastocatellia bacterium]|nr:hypothetical protein [Blastocatellia bacterium]